MAGAMENKSELENLGQPGTGTAERVKDVASSLGEKAKDAVSSVAKTAENMASHVGHKAEDATGKVGVGLKSLGKTIRDSAPQSGMVGEAASAVANTLESSGRYLQEEHLSQMAEDVTKLIRRNPIPAVLVGIGLGFLLAKITPRS